MDLKLIDFEALRKGSRIEADLIRRVVGISPQHRDFPLGVLRVKAAVEAHFWRRDGLYVTVVTKRDAILILDESPATLENAAAQRRGERVIRKAYRRNLDVDASKLSAEERARHERTLEVQARSVHALSRVRKNLRPGPHRRESPTAAG